LGDVLDALLAEILEAVRELAPNMVAHASRDAASAGLGQPLDAGGDVDAIAEDIAILHHDVADIDADAEPHPAIIREFLIRQGEVSLDFDRALDGSEDAAEFGQHAIAGCVAYPSAVLGNERIGDGAMSREGGKRRHLVDTHQAAVALDIRRQNGDEFSLEMWCFHVRPIHLSSSISARHRLKPACRPGLARTRALAQRRADNKHDNNARHARRLRSCDVTHGLRDRGDSTGLNPRGCPALNSRTFSSAC
jgi:hypothetical protein